MLICFLTQREDASLLTAMICEVIYEPRPEHQRMTSRKQQETAAHLLGDSRCHTSAETHHHVLQAHTDRLCNERCSYISLPFHPTFIFLSPPNTHSYISHSGKSGQYQFCHYWCCVKFNVVWNKAICWAQQHCSMTLDLKRILHQKNKHSSVIYSISKRAFRFFFCPIQWKWGPML